MNLQILKYSILVVTLINASSCKQFLELEPPKNSLVDETVFSSDDQATSAVTGIYASMSQSFFASGGSNSVTLFSGISSDELIGYNANNLPYYENNLYPELNSVSLLYSSMYQTIYAANLVLQGLSSSTMLSPSVKSQLEGEALFIRAFAYFYLTNLYGKVPLILDTDYRITSQASQTSVEGLYNQIFSDLLDAERKLFEVYPSTERVRPNKAVAQALLARAYLYRKDWINAEKYASKLIDRNTIYNLVNLEDVFLANSREAIWQLIPPANANTNEGNLFILTGTPTNVSLRSTFVLQGFEAGDRRQTQWTKSLTNSTGTYHYPFKYKVRASTTVTEYSMVLRLAEQYLIRAEARIRQGNIEFGISDLNTIRLRARAVPSVALPDPLPPRGDMPESAALLAVEQERRVELFAEWGHRWLDLKRTGRASSLLSGLKASWNETDQFYPIPQDEINRNSKILQNQGY